MAAKYEAVEAALSREVAALAPGDVLAPERTLAERHGVSRMTLRRAVEGLVARGLVERRHGTGTFVSAPRIAQPLTATSFTEDMRRRGLVPSSRVVAADSLAADAVLAERLGVAVADPVLRVTRLRLADGEPMAIETLHVAEALVPGLGGSDLDGAVSYYEILATRFGHRVARGTQAVEPVIVAPEEAAHLGVAAGAPALQFERVSRDQAGVVVEYVRSVYRGDRYRIQVDLTPPASLA